MTGSDQEKKPKAALWPVMLEIIRSYRTQFFQMTAFLGIGSVLEIAGIGFLIPLLAKLFGMDLLEDSRLEQLLSLAGLASLNTSSLLAFIVLFMAVRTWLLYQSNKIAGLTSIHVERHLRESVFKVLMNADWQFISGMKTGWVSNLATQEALYAGYAIQSMARFYVAAFLSFMFFAAAIALSLPAFVLTAVIIMPLLVIGKIINRKTRKAADERVALANVCNAHIIEALGQAKLIKSTDGIDVAVRRQHESVAGMSRMQEKNIRYVSLMATLPDAFILVALVVLVAASQVFQLSAPADFILFLLLMFRAQRFIGQAQTFQQRMVSLLPSYIACRELIAAAREAHEDTHENGKTPVFGKSIDLENIGFSYRPGEPVLKDVSLSIPCRATVAFAGRSGSGKTTLVDLLTGLLRPDDGAILVDGQPLSALNLKEWRRKIAYVPQDPVLFNGSLYDNITRDVTGDIKFEDVVRLAHVDEFAEKLPGKYDTLVGDRGMFFSGGQKQRIALARALMRGPEILILDEATSALDTISEEHIKHSLSALKNSITIILIAHRLSTIREADRIFVLEEGKLAQQGSYEDLSRDEGIFGRLAQHGA